MLITVDAHIVICLVICLGVDSPLMETPCLSFCSASLQLVHDKAAGWCVCEYCPHKGVCPPQRVSDHSATAEILYLKAQVTVPVICLEQCVTCVGAKELGRKRHSSLITSTSTNYTSKNL